MYTALKVFGFLLTAILQTPFRPQSLANKFATPASDNPAVRFQKSFRGDDGIRTHDPLLARQVLSQLSYTPIFLASTCSPMPSPA